MYLYYIYTYIIYILILYIYILILYIYTIHINIHTHTMLVHVVLSNPRFVHPTACRVGGIACLRGAFTQGALEDWQPMLGPHLEATAAHDEPGI